MLGEIFPHNDWKKLPLLAIDVALDSASERCMEVKTGDLANDEKISLSLLHKPIMGFTVSFRTAIKSVNNGREKNE